MRVQHMAALICVAMAVSSTAQAEGWWKLPDLNPFNDEAKPTSRTSSSSRRVERDDDKFVSRWPSAASRSKDADPSMWQKMKGGTGAFFAKTKKTLTPWKKEPERRQNSLGARRVYPSWHKPKEEKKGFFSWFAKEEPPQPRTVSEWIDLPRPY